VNTPADATAVVIDTNVALDLLVFDDPVAQPLRQALERRELRWLITQPMLDEARRVLDYPLIARRREASGLSVDMVMARWASLTTVVSEAPKAPYTCKDGDDQKFVDLAAQHRACLLSKDAAVLCMAKRLAHLGAVVQRQWPGQISANESVRALAQ
jgi:putative PIN family toxin of toxin-antitoxin system